MKEKQDNEERRGKKEKKVIKLIIKINNKSNS